jgi:branched-chain amino acid aminotransferase
MAYVDQSYVPLEDAKVSVLHWGFRRADTVYDVVSVADGAFFKLDAHLDRFERSMKIFHMSLSESRSEIRNIMHELVRRSGLRNATVTTDCVRGLPPDGAVAIPANAPCYLIAYVKPYYTIVPRNVVERGAHMMVSSIPRIPARSVDHRAKNFHRADMTQASFEALRAGADHPILLDEHGNVTEGPGFNVFAVTNGVVVTPDQGMLEGITRQAVTEICRKLGINCEIRPLPVREMRDADEIFITSTAGGVIGVTRLDGRIFTNDRPGDVTRRLSDAYWSMRKQGWDCEPVTYRHWN